MVVEVVGCELRFLQILSPFFCHSSGVYLSEFEGLIVFGMQSS